jgi:hypothetical protein
VPVYPGALCPGNFLDYKPEGQLIDPLRFRGESTITEAEVDAVIGTISMNLADFRTAILAENSTDARYDFVSIRSRVLF